MSNTNVNYIVAQLLLEKGYDERCRSFYKDWNDVVELYDCDRGQMFDYCYNTMLLREYTFEDEKNIAAPIQQDVIVWLRKNHNILLWCQPWEEHVKEGKWSLWNYYIKVPGKKVISSDGYGYFTTPELAINSALERILRELI